jgi:cell division septation protein DedD
LAYTQDDGFHEIQLNGKQLVFLFMAATVVSVVIFLCGVLVGRGVRAERGDLVQTSAANEATATDVALAAPGAALAPVPAATTGDPSVAAPAPSLDELSYFNRLEKPNPAPEALKTPEKPAAVARAAERPSPAPAAALVAPPAARAPAPPAPAAGPGYAVQIAALNVRSEADAVAKRLASKGYATYVDALPDRTPALFRVRVGAFKTKREAEAMAAKLKKEEQFNPWVTPR